MPLIAALEAGTVQPTETVSAFETGYAHWFAASRIDEEPLLIRFMVGEQEDRLVRLEKVGERMGELGSRYIRARLCGNIPDKSEVTGREGYGVLKHQLQRPSKPIRQLASDMGDAFTGWPRACS